MCSPESVNRKELEEDRGGQSKIKKIWWKSHHTTSVVCKIHKRRRVKKEMKGVFRKKIMSDMKTIKGNYLRPAKVKTPGQWVRGNYRKDAWMPRSVGWMKSTLFMLPIFPN